MGSSASEEESAMRNLEMEAHYLSQALSKLSPNSGEYEFLRSKLEAAEGEMEALRQDTRSFPASDPQIQTDNTSGPSPGRSGSFTSAAYREDDDEEYGGGGGDVGWNGEDLVGVGQVESPKNDENVGQVVENIVEAGSPPGYDAGYDDSSYEPVAHPSNNRQSPRSIHIGGGERIPIRSPYRDDPDEPYWDERSVMSTNSRNNNNNNNRRGYRDDPADGAAAAMNYRNSNTMHKMGGWTGTRRKAIASAVMMAILLVVCIVLFTTGKGDNSSAASYQDTKSTSTEGRTITEPCASFSVHLVPDQFGNETTWKILRHGDNNDSYSAQTKATTMLEGGPYAYKKGFGNDAGGSHYEMVHATACLPVGSYGFVVYDAKGDGMCCDYGRGEYGINLSKGKIIRPLSPAKFGAKDVTQFAVATEDIDVLPPPPVTDDALPSNSNAMSDADPTQQVMIQPTGPCASFSMHLIPDQFGNETSWKIRRHDGLGSKAMGDLSKLTKEDLSQGVPVMVGGPYEYKKDFDHSTAGSHYEMKHATTCLPVGTYTYTLYDKKGDGICCDYGRGEYGLNLSKGKVVRPLSLGKFTGAGQVTPFVVGTEDIDVVPALSSATIGAMAPTYNTPSDDAPDPSLAAEDAGGPDGAGDEEESPEDEACASFFLHLVPDQWGNETSWELLKYNRGETPGEEECQDLGVAGDGDDEDGTYFPTSAPVENSGRFLREALSGRRHMQASSSKKWTAILSGGPYSYQRDFDEPNDVAAGSSVYNAIIAQSCLPAACYKFVIYDAEDDGMCCEYGNGEYGINLSKGRVIRPLTRGKFGASEVTPFWVGEIDLDVFPEAESSEASEASPTMESLPSPAVDVGADANDEYDEYPSVMEVDPDDWPENAYEAVIPPDASDASASQPSSSSLPGTTSLKDEIEEVVSNMQLPSTSVSTHSSLSSLVTTMDNGGIATGRGKSYGILFDIQIAPTALPVIISHMDLFLDTMSPTHYEVWTKEGSWQDVTGTGSDVDYFAGFRDVSHGRITGSGPSDLTRTTPANFQDVRIEAGKRHAFWVSLSDNYLIYKSEESGDSSSHHAMKADAVQVSSAGKEFDVFYGVAVRTYPLELADPLTDFVYNVGFLGRLWYKDG